MIAISHFALALMNFFSFLLGIVTLVGILELLGRERIEPEADKFTHLCGDCQLIYSPADGTSKALARGICPRCAARTKQTTIPEDREFMEGL